MDKEKVKSVNEKKIVQIFLDILKITYDVEEIAAVASQHNPIDVMFRDANFQIKEIPSANIRRSGECYPLSNQKPEESDKNAYERLMEKLAEISKRYPIQSKADMDMLIYITNTATSVFTNEISIDEKKFSEFNFRSVSVVLAGKQALILYAAQKAPSFIRDNLSKIFTTGLTKNPKVEAKSIFNEEIGDFS